MHPEPQLLIKIVLNFQISSFCLGTRGQLAVCWFGNLRENVGRSIYSSPHFLCPGEKKAFVASVICSTEIVQAESSLFAVFGVEGIYQGVNLLAIFTGDHMG